MFIPPHLCLVLFLYSDICHLGAVSCRNPEPGGTHGRTWRLLGPTMERWWTGVYHSLSKAPFLCLFGWNVLLKLVQLIPKDSTGGTLTIRSGVLSLPFMSFLSPISTPNRSCSFTLKLNPRKVFFNQRGFASKVRKKNLVNH